MGGIRQADGEAEGEPAGQTAQVIPGLRFPFPFSGRDRGKFYSTVYLMIDVT